MRTGRSRMGRIIAGAVVFLLVGAMMTVVVAEMLTSRLGSNLLISPETPDVLRSLPPSGTAVAEGSADWKWVTLAALPHSADFPPRIVDERNVAGARFRAIATTPYDYWYGDRVFVLEIGWPALALQSANGVSANDSTGFRFTESVYPSRPMWPGFAINTIFYGVIIWLLVWAAVVVPFALRRRLRLRRNLCPACAYPIGVSPVCTECGAEVPNLKSKSREAASPHMRVRSGSL